MFPQPAMPSGNLLNMDMAKAAVCGVTHRWPMRIPSTCS